MIVKFLWKFSARSNGFVRTLATLWQSSSKEHVVNSHRCTAETGTRGLARRRRIRDGECTRGIIDARGSSIPLYQLPDQGRDEGLPLRSLTKSMDTSKDVDPYLVTDIKRHASDWSSGGGGSINENGPRGLLNTKFDEYFNALGYPLLRATFLIHGNEKERGTYTQGQHR